MTSTIDEFDFSGAEGATVAQESNKGGSFEREIEFLTLKADPVSIQSGLNRAFIRLVTDYERKPWMGDGRVNTTRWSLPWITVQQHYAPTRPKPDFAREGSKWPDKMFAVCRCDKVFAAKYGNVCLVCQQGHKASARSWALAVEREQVIEDGKVLGYRDKMRTVFDRDANGEAIVIGEKDGKKEYQMKEAPAWLVLNFGWKNFFGPLNGQASYFLTAMDRDFVVTRTGMENNDTMYSFVGLDKSTITGEWATQLGVPDGTPYDMGHVLGEVEGRQVPLMEILYPDMPDLRKIIAERTSPDYFGRWFDPSWVPEGYVPGQNGSNGQQQGQQGVQTGYNPTSAAPPQPTTPVAPAATTAPAAAGPAASALDALRSRVQSGQQG